MSISFRIFWPSKILGSLLLLILLWGRSQTTLTRFWLFNHLPSSCVDIFYGMIVDKKRTFLDHQPTSSCKRSLWTTQTITMWFESESILKQLETLFLTLGKKGQIRDPFLMKKACLVFIWVCQIYSSADLDCRKENSLLSSKQKQVNCARDLGS